MNSQDFRPDVQAAQQFLGLLDPQGLFTFQTFNEDKACNNGGLTKILHGALGQHSATLAALNQKGAGVMVNEGDGKGRAGGNITRVRALFVDLDAPHWSRS
jgi:hypothetical protein